MIPEVDNLIKIISQIPGMGPRSSRRFVFHLLKKKDILHIAKSMENAAKSVLTCKICGNIDNKSPCHICINERRDKNVLCIVEDIVDLWAIERSNIFNGVYHVLGGRLSAIEGVAPEDLNIQTLIKKIKEHDSLLEVIIATNPTMEGRTTGYYVADIIKQNIQKDVKTSFLGYGLPIGAEIDYMDECTLEFALKDRKAYG